MDFGLEWGGGGMQKPESNGKKDKIKMEKGNWFILYWKGQSAIGWMNDEGMRVKLKGEDE
jgi:hypothetical protein